MRHTNPIFALLVSLILAGCQNTQPQSPPRPNNPYPALPSAPAIPAPAPYLPPLSVQGATAAQFTHSVTGQVTSIEPGGTAPEYAVLYYNLGQPAPANARIFAAYGNERLSAPYPVPEGQMAGVLHLTTSFLLEAVYGRDAYQGRGSSDLIRAIQQLDQDHANGKTPGLRVHLR